ncbi:TlpA family protein disulfide reductase [Zobellia uliginosa]|uniref:TlpA family protein disulfide reductase n=1 Tax=Zobellia uliginosa TaxID=143224 RepID=UPI0026E485DC|nr:TlpA disulfide reductase family protein [Zobellia uliginosa]MDO6519570.1 TlpA disulfide reductase family protein [Zobellia uliginosa]
MRLHTILLSLLFMPFSYAQVASSTSSPKLKGHEASNEIAIYDFDALEPLLHTDSDKIHIVNFWAMWCAPCVKELPIIQEYEKNNPNVEVLLVSLDFPENIETKLKPFLKKKGITSKVVLLDDPDANSWIDKIDPNWSGAIPFTIVFNRRHRSYHERVFEDIEDLKSEINKIRNKK